MLCTLQVLWSFAKRQPAGDVHSIHRVTQIFEADFATVSLMALRLFGPDNIVIVISPFGATLRAPEGQTWLEKTPSWEVSTR